MSEQKNKIGIEVAYALPEKQKIVAMEVAYGTTARQAVEMSGIENLFPGEDIGQAPLGIFGQALGSKGAASAEAYVLKQGERVEIYRPLIADPKEVRRKRAEAARREREK